MITIEWRRMPEVESFPPTSSNSSSDRPSVAKIIRLIVSMTFRAFRATSKDVGDKRTANMGLTRDGVLGDPVG